MSTIRCIYHPKQDGSFEAPNFPASDQHPEARRYFVWASGRITESMKESPAEVQAIEMIEDNAKRLQEKADELTRDGELLKQGCQNGTLALAMLDSQIASRQAVLRTAGLPEAPASSLPALSQVAAAQDLRRRGGEDLAVLEDRAATKQAQAAAARAEHGQVEAYVMTPEQRRYLTRVLPPNRDVYIQATRKQRDAAIAADERPLMVVDAIGEPTMDEINAILHPEAAERGPAQDA